MKKLIPSIFLLVLLFIPAQAKASQTRLVVCVPSDSPGSYHLYLPLVSREATMAKPPATEALEKLLLKKKDFPYDGRIVEIFPEAVSVKLVGSPTIERNIAIPSHISQNELSKGMAVRLGMHQGRRILLAVFPQFDQDLSYAGKGSIIPDPPKLTVFATKDGWLVTWSPVPGAERYRVYRNDTADEVSPDDLGYTTARSLLCPYESPYIYFAAKSVSGLNESEVSGWVTDDTPPPVPDTFNPANTIDGHLMTIQGSDVSLTDASFKCWEIEMAGDDVGTGSVSLGNFYPQDLPYLNVFGAGTIKWYRISSIDWAGNQSDWTDWDDAWVIAGTLKDLFDGYGGSTLTPLESLWWLKVADFDTDEDWYCSPSVGTLSSETSIHREGDRAVKIVNITNETTAVLDVSLDFSNEQRFTDDDYIIIAVYAYLPDASNNLQIRYETVPETDYFHIWLTISAGWNFLKLKKSEFGEQGSPDWGDINELELHYYGSGGGYVIYDDLRIVKADPDDADDYNDTGRSWDKAARTGSDVGEWHIYEGNRSGEPSKPYSYGQIKTDASPSIWYLSHKPISTTDIISGTAQAGIYTKNNDGQSGLAFFVKDATADSWDMYVLEADSDADTITLAKYVAGVRTQIAQASFTFAPNQILWLGADFKEYDSDAGRIKVFASLSEGNLIQAANLILSEQDTEWLSDPGGSVGVLSYQANVRFVNFVAGSPAHAETASVAFSLDGPIIGGETRRVVYNRDDNTFEYTEDGETYLPVNAWVKVDTVELDDTAASVTFDLTDHQDGEALKLIYSAGTNRAAETDTIMCFFNSDTGNNYDRLTKLVYGTTYAVDVMRTTDLPYIALIDAANSTSPLDSAGEITIPAYTADDRYKLAYNSLSVRRGDASADSDLYNAQMEIFWKNNDPITSLTLTPGVGPNFVAGDRFVLYKLM